MARVHNGDCEMPRASAWQHSASWRYFTKART